MGEELVSEPYYCQLETETCRIFSEQLGTLALVGESLHMGAAKRLRLVLFSDSYCSTLEYNIRVYCMDDTQDVFKVNLVGKWEDGWKRVHRLTLVDRWMERWKDSYIYGWAV